MPRQASLDVPGTLHPHPHPGLVVDGTGTGKDCLNFESGVSGSAGTDGEEVRGLHLGNCQGQREGEG